MCACIRRALYVQVIKGNHNRSGHHVLKVIISIRIKYIDHHLGIPYTVC